MDLPANQIAIFQIEGDGEKIQKKVFLSSTFLDLQPEREAIGHALQRLDLNMVGMEYFGSDSAPPSNLSLQLLRTAMIYLCVIGHRYGSVARETGKSITQMEYEKAKEIGLPILIYVKDPKSPLEPTSQFIEFDDQKRDLLREFKNSLLESHTISTFLNPDDLAAKVTADLAKILARKSKSLDLFFRKDLVPMIGPVNVGKTMYGAMLAYCFRGELAARSGFLMKVDADLSPLTIADSFQVRAGNWLPRTTSLSRNLVGKFTLQKSRPIWGDRCCEIYLVDTSGETWINWGDGPKDLQLLGYSNAIAVFLDEPIPSLKPARKNGFGPKIVRLRR